MKSIRFPSLGLKRWLRVLEFERMPVRTALEDLAAQLLGAQAANGRS